MLPKNLSKRTYLIITIIISILFIYFTWNAVKSTKKAVINEIENDLIKIVILLEQKIPGAYDNLVRSKGGSSFSNTEKIQILNKYLQPIVEKVSKDWPGYGMGYYSKDQRIIALVPFNKGLLGKKASAEALEVYKKKELVISNIKNGFTWGKQTTIVGANYPLFHNGILIGHVWANIKTDSIQSAVVKAISRKILEFFLIWVALNLIIGYVMQTFNNTIRELIYQITNGSTEEYKLKEVPELIPVLNTVEMLKGKLRIEYEEKEKSNEEIARLDRLNIVGEMAATVAHEIRNPMTVVMGYAQLLSKKNTEFAEEFSIIINELKRTNEIIEDFLSLARNKKTPLKEEQLNDIVQSIFPLIYGDAVKKGITIEMELQPGIPKVLVNKREIKQLILNLVRNSIDVMDSSGVLKINTKYKNKDGYISLVIADTGSGICEEDIHKIFEPFFTTKSNGTGIGLPVCKNIVDRHNGRIVVNSKVGEGTIIMVSLPIMGV